MTSRLLIRNMNGKNPGISRVYSSFIHIDILCMIRNKSFMIKNVFFVFAQK